MEIIRARLQQALLDWCVAGHWSNVRISARGLGYTFVSHQQEVGTGYFDDLTTVIQGDSSGGKALTGSTEEEQFP